MSISNIIALLGGVALFLFGMGLMGDGLKHAAGNKMELFLYKLSSTPLKGVLLGTAVTAIIQSSSATSVMVVGFVNSAMMTLKQAISVILGSILGTSITGWIIALSELGGDSSGLLSLLSTSSLTGIIAIVGIVIRMTAKSESRKHMSSIMLGFAVLMYGISSMSGAVAPLKESPSFVLLMTKFSNPILGLLIGTVITAILQSASSACGLLQTLSFTGVISFNIAFPILLGINVGACVPVLISSIGAKADAKRAAFSYLFVSALGSLIVGVLFYILNAFLQFSFTDNILDAFSIALVNSLFRGVSVVILFPLISSIEKMLNKFIRDDVQDADAIIPPLEERFLVNPAVALIHCGDAVTSMIKVVGKHVNNAIALLSDYSDEGFRKVEELEGITDIYEDKIGAYVVKITASSLDKEETKEAAKYLHSIGDLERISDHALNIGECAQEIYEKKISFTERGYSELVVLFNALTEVMGLTFDAFIHNNVQTAMFVEPLETVIDNLCDEIKGKHILRVQTGECSLQHGYVFNDLLTNAERISDHCSNIALAIIEANADEFNAHEYINQLDNEKTEIFNKKFEMYSEKYSLNRT